jgi:hypothetical protein
VQERLNSATPSPAPPLAVDGIYGRRTKAAIVAFQRHHGLTPDGVVGQRTWGALTGQPATSGQVPAPKPGTAPASGKAVAPPPKAPPVDDGGLATGTEAVVEQAVTALADQPGEGDLPGNFVTQQLTAYFQKFAEVPVTIRGTSERAVVPPRTVKVHTPYFINADEKSAKRSQEELAKAEKARGQTAVKKFFAQVNKEQALGGWNALHGKSRPEHIQAILQKALDEGLIQPQDATHPTAEELETWLRTHGVGVDCSGFVSQALTSVIEKGRHATGQVGPAQAINLGSKGLKGGSEGFAKVGVGKECAGPACLKPGDTMYIPGHIRVVLSVTPRDGGIEFSTFESHAGATRVGLAQAHWFYPEADSFRRLQIKRGSGPWKDVKGKDLQAVYGRSESLAGLQ